MFFTLQQMRYNRESERRWEILVEEMQKTFQAERERNEAQRKWYEAQEATYRVLQEARQKAYQSRQEENQQQLMALLAQNQQIAALLIELLERRNGSAAGASD